MFDIAEFNHEYVLKDAKDLENVSVLKVLP